MAKDVKFNIKIAIDGKGQIVTASSSVQDLRGALNSAKNSADRLRESFINYNQAVQMMQNVAGAVSQLANTLNSVTEESRAFASSMKAANTMAGKDAAGFERLKGQVSELSKTIPVARDQLANGLYQVISNGVPEDNWISYLEASARSSVGGIADIGEVVKVTSTIIKNYGLEWSAAQDIQDKIQLTAKNGVTSFEQLAAALPSVTGQAAQLGVSFSEMLGVMSTLTGVTGNTSEVATQLSSVLTALTKESTKSQKMADQMGISFNAASIKAAGGLRNYLMELDKTVTAYTQKTGELKESVYSKLFGRAEALRLVNALTGQLSEKYAENIAALESSEGTMQAAYEDMASTGASKLQVLKNEWEKYTDWIADKVGGIQPILTFGSQMGMTIVSVLTLVQAFQKLHLTQMLMSKSLLRNIAAYALFGTNTRKASMAVNVMTNSFRSAATRAIALKIAIRGLLVTTGVGIALMDLVDFLLVLKHAGVGGDKLLAVEVLSEAFVGFLALLLYFLLDLGYVVFYEHVGAVAFLAVFVVDEGVVEGVHVSAGLPDARVHEDGAVYAHNVLVHLHHGLPPCLLDVVLEFGAQLAVVVHGGKAVVDFAAREDESVFFGVGYHFLEEIVLVCHIVFFILFHNFIKRITHALPLYCAWRRKKYP